MKIFKKKAECVAIEYHNGERLFDWRCPNPKCRHGVAEDYICCPYCGQRLEFDRKSVKIDSYKIQLGFKKQMGE